MDNVAIKDLVFDKKSDGYKFEENNFVASQEITVTITLGEYRKLIEDNATAKRRIEDANEDKYSRQAENESLKKENEELKVELYELRKKMDGECVNEVDECEREEEVNG